MDVTLVSFISIVVSFCQLIRKSDCILFTFVTITIVHNNYSCFLFS